MIYLVKMFRLCSDNVQTLLRLFRQCSECSKSVQTFQTMISLQSQEILNRPVFVLEILKKSEQILNILNIDWTFWTNSEHSEHSEYCRIENYIHVVRSATLHLQLKIKTFQKCTIKNKEVEIMEGWCLSGYDGRCQTPTSQTHHDVPHYLPSHRNTIYYLSHSI
jgi:hypothetical protein